MQRSLASEIIRKLYLKNRLGLADAERREQSSARPKTEIHLNGNSETLSWNNTSRPAAGIAEQMKVLGVVLDRRLMPSSHRRRGQEKSKSLSCLVRVCGVK